LVLIAYCLISFVSFACPGVPWVVRRFGFDFAFCVFAVAYCLLPDFLRVLRGWKVWF